MPLRRDWEPRRHLLDPKRGRASVTKCWTVCGKAARCCYVSRLTTNITCEDCLAQMAGGKG
jgi:hypothetical protein